MIAGQTNSATTLDQPCQPLEAGHSIAMVERQDTAMARAGYAMTMTTPSNHTQLKVTIIRKYAVP